MHRIALVICLLSFPGLAMAGAWTQKKHGYFLKISTNYLFTTKEFNHEGTRLDIFQERLIYQNTSFRDINVTLYGEYGLSDRVTLIGSLPVKTLTSRRTELIFGGQVQRDVVTTTAGPADLYLASKVGLWARPVVLSLQAGIKVPLGYDAKPANDGPPLGTGHVDLDLQWLVGASLHPLPGYVTGALGYRYRSGPLHDEWFFSLEAGLSARRFLFKVNLDGLKNTVPPPDIVGQPVTTPLPGGGGALPNIIIGDQDIFKISPSVIYYLRPRWVIQTEALHIFAGKDTISGTIYSLGVVVVR